MATYRPLAGVSAIFAADDLRGRLREQCEGLSPELVESLVALCVAGSHVEARRIIAAEKHTFAYRVKHTLFQIEGIGGDLAAKVKDAFARHL